jgi:hypothetical protein
LQTTPTNSTADATDVQQMLRDKAAKILIGAAAKNVKVPVKYNIFKKKGGKFQSKRKGVADSTQTTTIETAVTSVADLDAVEHITATSSAASDEDNHSENEPTLSIDEDNELLPDNHAPQPAAVKMGEKRASRKPSSHERQRLFGDNSTTDTRCAWESTDVDALKSMLVLCMLQRSNELAATRAADLIASG